MVTAIAADCYTFAHETRMCITISMFPIPFRRYILSMVKHLNILLSHTQTSFSWGWVSPASHTLRRERVWLARLGLVREWDYQKGGKNGWAVGGEGELGARPSWRLFCFLSCRRSSSSLYLHQLMQSYFRQYTSVMDDRDTTRGNLFTIFTPRSPRKWTTPIIISLASQTLSVPQHRSLSVCGVQSHTLKATGAAEWKGSGLRD